MFSKIFSRKQPKSEYMEGVSNAIYFPPKGTPVIPRNWFAHITGLSEHDLRSNPEYLNDILVSQAIEIAESTKHVWSIKNQKT